MSRFVLATKILILTLALPLSTLKGEQYRPAEIDLVREKTPTTSFNPASRFLHEGEGCQLCHDTGDCSRAAHDNGPGVACPYTGGVKECCPERYTCGGSRYCKSDPAQPSECQLCDEIGKCDKAYFGNPGKFCSKTSREYICCGEGDICSTFDCGMTGASVVLPVTKMPSSKTEPETSSPSTEPESTPPNTGADSPPSSPGIGNSSLDLENPDTTNSESHDTTKKPKIDFGKIFDSIIDDDNSMSIATNICLTYTTVFTAVSALLALL